LTKKPSLIIGRKGSVGEVYYSMSLSNDLLRAERLRQSILKQAFSGQLVPSDPADEPASVLLDRIRKTSSDRTIKKKTSLTGRKAIKKERIPQ